MIQIVRAKDSDSREIKAFIFSVLKEHGLTPAPKTTDADLEAIDDTYNSNSGYFGLMKSSEQIVATVGISKVSEEICELRKMYLHTSLRGQGIGEEILRFSIEKAKSLGYRKMVLETESSLKKAIALYKRFGFKQYKPDHISARCDQAYMLEFFPALRF